MALFGIISLRYLRYIAECQISIDLDDGWCQQFCLDPYILGNWKVKYEMKIYFSSSSIFRLVYMGVKKEDTKEEI